MSDSLCTHCCAIFKPATSSTPFFNTINSGAHYDAAPSFFDAADRGCYICTILASRIDTDTIYRLRQSTQKQGFTKFSLTKSDSSARGDYPGSMSLLIWIDEQGRFEGKLKKQLDFLPGRYLSELQVTFVLTKLSDGNTTWSKFRRIESGSRASRPETIILIKDWMDSCQKNHPICKEFISAAKYQPRRLLYVGASEAPKLKLIDTHETPLNGSYASLSHCWGKQPIHRLLGSNIEVMKQSVDSSNLPPNFLDAISITRAIGIQYLWIDSLCIIQDSQIDWQQQAPLMCDIYRNSVCNIAATKSKDSYEGLFTERKSPLQTPVTVNMITGDGKSETFVLGDHDYFSSRVNGAPLNRRAWVLQERYLSPCTIHFVYDQVLWECYENTASEEYPKNVPRLLGGRDGKRALTPSATLEQAQKFWKACLTNYTRCGLSFGSDKLVAISGLARSVQPFLGVEYLAGIWKLDIIRELLWRSEGIHLTERRKTYRAPSWSWASIKGPIDLSYVSDSGDLVSLVGHSVTLVGDDPFGQVSDAYLRLSGQLIPCKDTVDQQGMDFQTPTLPLLDIGDEINWDEIITSNDTEKYDLPIYYAPFLIREDEDEAIGLQILGLILVEAEGRPQGYYSRIGVFTVSENNNEIFFLEESVTEANPSLYEEGNNSDTIYRIV